jgi:hypothetical protein
MSDFAVQVGREGWVTIRASAEALTALAEHLAGFDQDLGAAITEGLAATPAQPRPVSDSPAARYGRARRVAYAALQERYRDEFEGLYARMMEVDQGPTRQARRVTGITPHKASCNPGEVDRNNKRNRCRGRAWTILARAHADEFGVLFDDALARDEGPVAPYARRRLRLA